MEYARVTTRMAYSLFQEAHGAERDALEARGDAQLMEAVKGASKAEADAATMKLFYEDEIQRLRRVNDVNCVKFMSATGVTMDKWDGDADSLRKLLLAQEAKAAQRQRDAPVFARRPVGPKPDPTAIATPAAAPAKKPADTSLRVKPDVTAKVTDALKPKLKGPESGDEADMET